MIGLTGCDIMTEFHELQDKRKRAINKLIVILALVGVVLSLNNFAGSYISLRNPAIYQEQGNKFSNDPNPEPK